MPPGSLGHGGGGGNTAAWGQGRVAGDRGTCGPRGVRAPDPSCPRTRAQTHTCQRASHERPHRAHQGHVPTRGRKTQTGQSAVGPDLKKHEEGKKMGHPTKHKDEHGSSSDSSSSSSESSGEHHGKPHCPGHEHKKKKEKKLNKEKKPQKEKSKEKKSH
ncbi:immortalization up-regulated protein isoform X1 [Eretmochelys imbricata]